MSALFHARMNPRGAKPHAVVYRIAEPHVAGLRIAWTFERVKEDRPPAAQMFYFNI